MKKRTRNIVIIGTVLILPLVALAILPFVFRDRIIEGVKAQANSAIEARVNWRDVGLSIFRDFPNLTLRLDDVSVAGTRRFTGDTLAKVRRLQVVLDLGSVLRNVRGGGP